MQILLPRRWISVGDIANESIVRPLFFLGGPVRGGGDWQAEMALELEKQKMVENCIVACPCRWGSDHTLAQKFIAGQEHTFARQLDWERHYYMLAATHARIPGCIVCYLPLESETDPHPGPEPYAMDTRGELGEWRMRMEVDGARLVLGADPNFLGLSQIQRNFSAVLGYDFPVYHSIRETARAAVRMALGF